LYSRRATVGAKDLEIIVGYAMKAAWKAIETPQSLLPDVDAVLARDLDRTIASVSMSASSVRSSRNNFSSDGFQVVDRRTNAVVQWGPWVPSFFPKGVPLPAEGIHLYVRNGTVYIAQTDTDRRGRLLTTSYVEVSDFGWMIASATVGFGFAIFAARALSRRFLRAYFAFTGVRVPTLEEACRMGEGQNVEFKRGLSDDESRSGGAEDELLKTIAAFANTNDGVIFIGVDDAGHIKGLPLDFKQKDRLEQKIRQLVRNRIRPTTFVQFGFEDVAGLLVARVVVGRGEAIPT
jgi:hypothetical protein